MQIQEFKVLVEGSELSIPYRLYTDIYRPLNMTEDQSLVWSCLYTRMSDGNTRERFLKEIILVEHPYVVPFVIQLCGEYVHEIISIIHKNIELLNLSLYKDFITNNPEYISKTKQRIISYRNCYFQHEQNDKESRIAHDIIQHIEQN